MKKPIAEFLSLLFAGALLLPWFAGQVVGAFAAFATVGNSLPVVLLFGHALATALLWMAVSWACKRWPKAAPPSPSVGAFSLKDAMRLGGLMFAGYAIHHIFVKVTGQRQEHYMQQVMALPGWQFAVAVGAASFLVPLSEELAFRHVLSGLPSAPAPELNVGGWFRILVAVFVFACIHRQYEFLSTFVLLIWVAIVCMWARWKTGGLALPVALHGFASILALIFNCFY